MPAKKRVVSFLAAEKTPPAESWGAKNAREQLERSQHEDTQRDIATGGQMPSGSEMAADEAAQQAAGVTADAVARAAQQAREVATPAAADATAVHPVDEAIDQGAADMMDAVKRRAARNRRP